MKEWHNKFTEYRRFSPVMFDIDGGNFTVDLA